MLAEATNLGLSKMASATPSMTKDRLTWFSDWYLRDECYTKMLAEIVNYHHRHPFSAHWGDGTTSSRRLGNDFQSAVHAVTRPRSMANMAQNPAWSFIPTFP